MTVSAFAPDGAPEITPGTDLAAALLALVEPSDGDIVVVTSKVVSKAEGRVRPGAREEHVDAETTRVVARRGPTVIARTRHGLVLAAAGVDGSNVAAGHAVLLPLDPDDSARRLRRALIERSGRTLAVVVTDTAGRAWREGQTDIAVGAAGLRVAETFAGRLDAHGNELAVTLPAVADEVAGLAELAQGKLTGRPFAIVRGRADLVLPPDDDGPGAVSLIRPDGADLFGWGAREAVLRALRADPADAAPFGAPVPAVELVRALATIGVSAQVLGDSEVHCPAAPAGLVTAAHAVAFAHGWRPAPDGAPRPDGDLRFAPIAP